MLVAPRWLHISYLEAAILGAILGAVSPAVVVPLMIDFMDRGRGGKKGIPTLVLAASSIDDVFVIVLFSIFLGMHGGGSVNIWAKLGEIPVSIALGIIVGIMAIGIIISGEKILDYAERSPYKFKDLRERHGLPCVGERVRSKQYGTV